MRVISGQFRGRQLKALKGNNTRPTTDRVKESLMSSIVSALDGFDDLTVLDAFAGSGGLGIEAISRGAKMVVFCENHREAQGIVLANLNLVKADKSVYRLVKEDVLKVPFSVRNYSYDLVFLDPPYAYKAQDVLSFVNKLDSECCLSNSALICYEHAKTNKTEVFEAAKEFGFHVASSKDFGDTSVSMIRKDA